MSNEARELLERALRLPEVERALLVDALSGTIGGGAVEPAFAEELKKRARSVLEGGERGEPASSVMARLRAKHGLA